MSENVIEDEVVIFDVKGRENFERLTNEALNSEASVEPIMDESPEDFGIASEDANGNRRARPYQGLF